MWSLFVLTILLLSFIIPLSCVSVSASDVRPRPVVFSTDIGNDFDDSNAITWALTLHKQRVVDLQLVLCSTKDTVGRARLLARYMIRYGVFDVPIGIGVRTSLDYVGPLADWDGANSSDPLATFIKMGGTVYLDGVSALNDIIVKYPASLVLFLIAPATDVAEFLHRFPETAISGCEIVAMFGALNYCYDHTPNNNRTGTCAEFNVQQNVSAAQRTLLAPWRRITVTPLDTCGQPFSVMKGAAWRDLQRVASDEKLRAHVLLDSYYYWCPRCPWWHPAHGCESESDINYDSVTLVMYLTQNNNNNNKNPLRYQIVNITVNDMGQMHVADVGTGTPVKMALEWNPNGTEMFFAMFTAAVSLPIS